MDEILANQHQANKSANDLMRLPAGGHALTGPCAAANANRRIIVPKERYNERPRFFLRASYCKQSINY